MLEKDRLLKKQEDHASFSVYFMGKNIKIGNTILPAGQISVDILSLSDEYLSELHNAALQLKQAFDFMYTNPNIEVYFKDLADGIIPLLRKTLKVLDKLSIYKYLNLNTKEIITRLKKSYGVFTRREAMYEFGDFVSSVIACHDEIHVFKIYLTYLVNTYLEKTKKKNPQYYARAVHDFFNNKLMQAEIEAYRPPNDELGNIFIVEQPAYIEYVSMPDFDNPSEYKIAERKIFRSLGGFLNADFYHALSVGHAPRQCHNCNRYFLLTEGYDTRYCNNIAPNDKKGRTCRVIGAHNKEQELSQIGFRQAYKRAYDRIRKRLSAGKITYIEYLSKTQTAQQIYDSAKKGKISEIDAVKDLNEL